MKLAFCRASEVMYGASGLPMICVWEWFSSTTITTWSGRGTVVVPAVEGPSATTNDRNEHIRVSSPRLTNVLTRTTSTPTRVS